MTCRTVNPWTWQEAFGFSQGVEIRAASRTLLISGQTSINAEGQPGSVCDMAGQTTAAIDNLDTVLREAGMTFDNVVRLAIFTTDVDRYLAEGHETMTSRVGHSAYAMTLLGVARLAFPELLVEIEATAVASD
jgi:enamine deaminase RidA (YjgF/YER057c/UK114 family)